MNSPPPAARHSRFLSRCEAVAGAFALIARTLGLLKKKKLPPFVCSLPVYSTSICQPHYSSEIIAKTLNGQICFVVGVPQQAGLEECSRRPIRRIIIGC